jgi:hypothetical protein
MSTLLGSTHNLYVALWLLLLPCVVSSLGWNRLSLQQDGVCVDGYLQNIDYDIEVPRSQHFFVLEDAFGLKGVSCSESKTHMTLDFEASDHRDAALLTLNAAELLFVTSKGKHSKCHHSMSDDERFSLARIVRSRSLDNLSLTLDLIDVALTEVMREGTVDFEVVGRCKNGNDDTPTNFTEQFCAGLNAISRDDECLQDLGFDLAKNSGVDAFCQSCSLIFEGTAFLHMEMGRNVVNDVKVGMLDVNLSGDYVLSNRVVSPGASIHTNQQLQIPQYMGIFSIPVGNVIIQMQFSFGPNTVQIDGSYQQKAVASSGLIFYWPLYNHTMEWNRATNPHWNVPTPPPPTHVYGSVGGEAAFSGHVSSQLVPVYQIDIKQLITMESTFSPQFEADIEGNIARNEVCSKSTYQLQLTVAGQLHISIGDDPTKDSWGPKVMYDSGVQQLPYHCEHSQ